MKKYPARRPRKIAFILVSLLLLVAVVVLSVFITHKPRALWRIIASVNMHLPPTPTASERFNTLPPGAKLPSESECAARVRRYAWEPRTDNTAANNSVPTAQQISQLAHWGPAIGVDPRADTLRRQVTGDFTGTTDEILQWAACKWGIDEDIVRAEVVQESYWHQSQVGDWTTNRDDCPPGSWSGEGCYQSYGILQLKYSVFQSTWSMSRYDTAFNADFVYAVIRTCYEGWTTYLNDRTPVAGFPRYHAGGIWGCLGRWYSGGWYDQGAIDYINSVKSYLANRDWLQPGF
jgi:hypothetical protein